MLVLTAHDWQQILIQYGTRRTRVRVLYPRTSTRTVGAVVVEELILIPNIDNMPWAGAKPMPKNEKYGSPILITIANKDYVFDRPIWRFTMATEVSEWYRTVSFDRSTKLCHSTTPKFQAASTRTSTRSVRKCQPADIAVHPAWCTLSTVRVLVP